MIMSRTILAAIAISGIVGVGIATTTTIHSSASSVDEQTIEQIVTQAERAKLTLAVAEAPVPGQALDAIGLQVAQTHAAGVLKSLYASVSPLLATRLQQAQHGFDLQRYGYVRALDGGIRDVAFDSVAITGTVATAHLTFTGYSHIAVKQPDGQVVNSVPTNKFISDVTLLKTDQGWRISDEVARFAPGSEP